jgi:phospholipase C
LADTWNSAYSQGRHDLTVHGPNGFLRAFQGPGATATPEVTARHNAGTGNLDLTLKNSGPTACVLTLTNAYGGRRETVALSTGQSVVHTVDLGQSASWYDVTVGSDKDTSFLRRFAGHVETGKPGVSDPAIITA